MPHLMNPQPGLLKQVVSLLAAHELSAQEPVKLRAQTADQFRGAIEITLLIADHQQLQMAIVFHFQLVVSLTRDEKLR
jgi:hypothetical protein